jgi:hypothetical protein
MTLLTKKHRTISSLCLFLFFPQPSNKFAASVKKEKSPSLSRQGFVVTEAIVLFNFDLIKDIAKILMFIDAFD